jgi:hypothetical protein
MYLKGESTEQGCVIVYLFPNSMSSVGKETMPHDNGSLEVAMGKIITPWKLAKIKNIGSLSLPKSYLTFTSQVFKHLETHHW